MGFLQNAYTSSEEYAKKCEAMFTDPKIAGRMQVIRKEGLFEGRNFTGLRIKRYFGAEMVDSIWWENASPKWGWLSKHSFPADHDHIVRLLKDHSPQVVLAFGKTASDALLEIKNLRGDEEAWSAFTLITGPHPAARQSDVVTRLQGMQLALMNEIPEACAHCGKYSILGSHCQWCYKPQSSEEQQWEDLALDLYEKQEVCKQ